MRHTVPILSVLMILTASISRAQDGKSNEIVVLNPAVRFLVISEKAGVMAGDAAASTVDQGTVVAASHTRGPWKFSAPQKGWLHEADLIPLDKAVEHFSAQIAKQPTAIAYQLRGIARSAQNDWQKAAADFEQAYSLGDNSVAVHYNLGLAYRELSQHEKALGEFDTVLKLFPDDLKTIVARANLHVVREDFAKALVDLDRAVVLNPASAELHNERGVALRMQGRYVEALEAYSRAIALEPKHAEAHSNRAFALKSTANYADAVRDYRAALEFDPKSADIKNDLAWFLATCPETSYRRPEEALKLAKEICEASKFETGEFVDTLAAAYASQKDFNSAVLTEKLALPLLVGTTHQQPAEDRLKLYEASQQFFDHPPKAEAAPQPTPSPVIAPEPTPAKSM